MPDNDDAAVLIQRRLIEVEIVLRDLGLPRLYLRACPLIGVLSVALGVTAWCEGLTLTWRQASEEVTWSVVDVEGAAHRLAELAGTV